MTKGSAVFRLLALLLLQHMLTTTGCGCLSSAVIHLTGSAPSTLSRRRLHLNTFGCEMKHLWILLDNLIFSCPSCFISTCFLCVCSSAGTAWKYPLCPYWTWAAANRATASFESSLRWNALKAAGHTWTAEWLMIRHAAFKTRSSKYDNKVTVVVISDRVWNGISRNYSMWKSLEWLHEHKCTNMHTRRGLISIHLCNPPHDHLSLQCVSIKTRLDPHWEAFADNCIVGFVCVCHDILFRNTLRPPSLVM